MGACGGKSALDAAAHEGVGLVKANTNTNRRRAKAKQGNIGDELVVCTKLLGEGTYGSVYKARSKHTGRVYAVKTFSKRRLVDWHKTVHQEVALMKMMDHPNIVKLYATFEDPKSLHLVMELCAGGELFDTIIANKKFSEHDAAVVIRQIMRAVRYLHINNVCHRDLKPENFMLLSKAPIEENVVKLIDFGTACTAKPGKYMMTKIGTPFYIAPEVLAGRYNHMCDLWSIGVILYTLLCGYPPFNGKTDAEIFARVHHGNVVFEARHWSHISQDAKSLTRSLLTINPRVRWTAEQALGHDFFRHATMRTAKLQQSYIENLQRFRRHSSFKKVVLNIIAGRLNEDKIAELRDVFTTLDSNGDGILTLDELKEGLQGAGVVRTDSELEHLVRDVDCDGSGAIEYTEFLAASLERSKLLAEDSLRSAFNFLDVNQDGRISTDDLRQSLGEEMLCNADDLECFAGLLHDADQDSDGTVDLEGFMAMMLATPTVADRGLQPSLDVVPLGKQGGCQGRPVPTLIVSDRTKYTTAEAPVAFCAQSTCTTPTSAGALDHSLESISFSSAAAANEFTRGIGSDQPARVPAQ